METLKLGSKGASVKELQKLLGLKVDGDFGPKTENAVKNFQKNHNLTEDGIVGSKTWQLLQKDDINIIHKHLSVHITKCPNRPIKYLSIHFTAGSNSKPGKALTMYNTFTTRSASADFVVDDKDIVQFNPDLSNYYCWAVGDAKKKTRGGALNRKAVNKNTLSIEICSTCVPSTTLAVNTPNHTGWSFTEAALNNAAKLAKYLIKKYNIPLENVVRHYDITGKVCPGIIGWNEEPICDILTGKVTTKRSDSSKWIEFKNRLK